jgi:hypothetical protein
MTHARRSNVLFAAVLVVGIYMMDFALLQLQIQPIQRMNEMMRVSIPLLLRRIQRNDPRHDMMDSSTTSTSTNHSGIDIAADMFERWRSSFRGEPSNEILNDILSEEYDINGDEEEWDGDEEEEWEEEEWEEEEWDEDERDDEEEWDEAEVWDEEEYYQDDVGDDWDEEESECVCYGDDDDECYLEFLDV